MGSMSINLQLFSLREKCFWVLRGGAGREKGLKNSLFLCFEEILFILKYVLREDRGYLDVLVFSEKRCDFLTLQASVGFCLAAIFMILLLFLRSKLGGVNRITSYHPCTVVGSGGLLKLKLGASL